MKAWHHDDAEVQPGVRMRRRHAVKRMCHLIGSVAQLVRAVVHVHPEHPSGPQRLEGKTQMLTLLERPQVWIAHLCTELFVHKLRGIEFSIKSLSSG